MTGGKAREAAERTLSEWGTPLDPSAWELLDKYLRDVLEYNRKVNLTAAAGLGELLARHAMDSLASLAPLRELLAGRARPRILDAGAGAGFIGICLKIAWPDAAVTLLESSYRKVCFLNWAAARIGFRDLRVLHGRARGGRIHPLGPGGGKKGGDVEADFDAVVARALAPLPEALSLTLPLARRGGSGLLYQSERPDLEDAALAGALLRTGARLERARPYRLPDESRDRHLLIFRRQE